MPPLNHLVGKHPGSDLYVIGTGPSLRVFPLETLSGELTVGLNQAWRHGDWTYNLTVHGELVRDQEEKEPDKRRDWIVSAKKKPLCAGMQDPDYWVFWSKQDAHFLKKRSAVQAKKKENQADSFLYLMHGIQTTALHLGYLLGCKRIYLVGVDMGILDHDHHAHRQHVKYHDKEPKAVFRDMREETRYVRTWLRKQGVHVLNLSALIGSEPQEDYAHLVHELALDQLPEPEDTSECVWAYGYQGDKL